jgi:hypothetical protein
MFSSHYEIQRCEIILILPRSLLSWHAHIFQISSSQPSIQKDFDVNLLLIS